MELPTIRMVFSNVNQLRCSFIFRVILSPIDANALSLLLSQHPRLPKITPYVSAWPTGRPPSHAMPTSTMNAVSALMRRRSGLSAPTGVDTLGSIMTW
ncbi:hypothetical protein T05_9704 [Trichinella murrelli]|uniref:Uncharacterized protein n=1 Tax=Trichinella murrelli TaxID=144512 RepID=A0A0V0T7P2_9BILA|nr:hypothetical protein T05_9704 [Trichinella murrelli]